MRMDRPDRLAAALAERELDALLVTNLVNVRWLTGFTGSNGLAVVGSGASGLRLFLTDFRYLTQSAEQLDDGWERRITPEVLPAAAEAVGAGAGERPLRVGFDDAHAVGQGPRGAGRPRSATASSSCPPAAWSRSCARSRTPASSTRSARRPRWPTRR